MYVKGSFPIRLYPPPMARLPVEQAMDTIFWESLVSSETPETTS
jgi:hypothetical protein